MKDFFGKIDDLKTLLKEKGIDGDWSKKQDGAYALSVTEPSNCRGAVLNWWENSKKKTISCQGKKDVKEQLENLLSDEEQQSETAKDKNNQGFNGKKIFIVHGHDEIAREQLELILGRFNLQSYVLQNNANAGDTIIEALEKHTCKDSSSFGIVLMTPDDYGYSKEKTDSERQPRARQNVILEMGMLLSSLTRKRMLILKKGNLEIPSDIDGILRLEFNDHVKEVANSLGEHLIKAGFEISQENLLAGGK